MRGNRLPTRAGRERKTDRGRSDSPLGSTTPTLSSAPTSSRANELGSTGPKPIARQDQDQDQDQTGPIVALQDASDDRPPSPAVESSDVHAGHPVSSLSCVPIEMLAVEDERVEGGSEGDRSELVLGPVSSVAGPGAGAVPPAAENDSRTGDPALASTGGLEDESVFDGYGGFDEVGMPPDLREQPSPERPVSRVPPCLGRSPEGPLQSPH